MANWVILVGSPYDQGKCSNAATRIADALRELGSHVELFSCARITVHGCIGCDRCKENFTCIYSDDLARISSALDTADAVLVVSPIYFAGVPSQFKAVLDRFQPYFWKRQQQIEQGRPLPPKRALYVALVGEGGDPYGTAPAQAQVASPFALADFSVVDARDLIAVDEDTIVSETLQMIEQGRGEERIWGVSLRLLLLRILGQCSTDSD